MGQGVARDLIKQDRVESVILADLYPDPERLSTKLRESEKTTLIKMDVGDHDAMVKAFGDVNVVINTAGPFYKTAVPVAKAAVQAKVNYIDICDDYEGTEVLFNSEIDQLAKRCRHYRAHRNGVGPGHKQCIGQMVRGPSRRSG